MQLVPDTLSDVLFRCPHFGLLLSLCKSNNAYLVGGALRDALVGRSISDLDLICPQDPTRLAQNFARQIGGHWFWLDKERRQSRVVVVNSGEACLYYDFALFRAPTLRADLLDRDFTINAMALPLASSLSISDLVDPLGGLEDLEQNRLRMVSASSFNNDPLRILKGIRHATALGLAIEPSTQVSISNNLSGLNRVAPERIRQEVWSILDDSSAQRGLILLAESGIGQQLFTHAYAEAVPGLVACLDACRSQWRLLAESSRVLHGWLSVEVEQGLNVETLLLFIFLLKAIDPELPVFLAERWRLSRKAKSTVSAILSLNEETHCELASVSHTSRAYAWWAARYRIDPKLLLLALAAADMNASAADRATILAWIPLVDAVGQSKLTDLVDGHWLRNELCINDGPEMTKALELLRNAEISGEVASAEDAKDFLCRYYHNKH